MVGGQKTPRGHPDFHFCENSIFLRSVKDTTNSYVIPQKASLWNFLVNTLLLYIHLLTLTDGITDGETHTLAARGLEELFFQLCFCVSFWFWQEIGFGFIYYVLMYLEYNTVVVLC